MVHNYVIPRLDDVRLGALRADHLDDLYDHLLTCGGRKGQPLAAKTVHEKHLILRNALDLAVQRRLVDRNVALTIHSPRRRSAGSAVARVWNAQELAAFIDVAGDQRLYPALHLAAHTGMRRGEGAGLKWERPQPRRQATVDLADGAKRRRHPDRVRRQDPTSRRCVDLDEITVSELSRWRRRLRRDRLPHGDDGWMFCNTKGRFLNPESLSQLFGRLLRRSGLPRIRFHDLRHTHASLLVANGVPIKVDTERLGHAHPAFTMHTYQHLLPGMSAEAATRFAGLVSAANR